MEKMLLKMARQLNAMDEASLMALWDKYMAKVQHFDGSTAWEEAAIVLALIQAVHGKNQLFNAHLDLVRENAQQRQQSGGLSPAPAMEAPRPAAKKGKIIPFRPLG